jgi:hypothetical protein
MGVKCGFGKHSSHCDTCPRPYRIALCKCMPLSEKRVHGCRPMYLAICVNVKLRRDWRHIVARIGYSPPSWLYGQPTAASSETHHSFRWLSHSGKFSFGNVGLLSEIIQFTLASSVALMTALLSFTWLHAIMFSVFVSFIWWYTSVVLVSYNCVPLDVLLVTTCNLFARLWTRLLTFLRHHIFRYLFLVNWFDTTHG